MAWGCRHNDTIAINRFDLDGVLNVMARRIGGLRSDEIDERSYYAGAFNALYTCESHEWRDQTEFYEVFDALMDALPGGDESGED